MLARLDREKSRTALLLLSLTALALGLDLWQSAAQRAGGASWFDAAVCSVARPLQGMLLTSAQFVEGEWMATVHARDVIEENARLSTQVGALETALLEREEDRAAQVRAAELFAAHTGEGAAAPRLARIIGVGEGPWSRYFTLDRGSADGAEIEDVALTADGVVGQVYAVAERTSRLMPLTEPASAVAVRLQRSRDEGILKGLGDWRCEIWYLDPEADVVVGDRAITSGLGGIFPKGLRVGTVVAIREDLETPGKVAVVEPAASLEKVEEVLLVRAGEGAKVP